MASFLSVEQMLIELMLFLYYNSFSAAYPTSGCFPVLLLENPLGSSAKDYVLSP